MRIGIVIFMLLHSYFLHAQCSSGCTTTLTGNSTGNITVSSGQTLCINATTQNISITHNLRLESGGTIKVCSSGSYTVTISGAGVSFPNPPSSRNFYNYGTLIFTPFYNNSGIEQNLAISNTIFTNQGHVTFPKLQLNSGTDIQNTGTLVVNGTLGTNASSSFTNTGLFDISGNADLNGNYTTSGVIKANSLTLNAAGTVNISGGMFIANNLILNSGTVNSGSGSSCAAFLIKGTTTIASNSFLVGSGEVVIVDSTNLNSVDVNNCPTAANCGLTFGSSSASSACFNNVLPLTWLDFQVNKTVINTELYWVTSSEENVSHFAIETSEDGISFDSVGHVLANNQYFNQYVFYHPLAYADYVYYRIKQVDYDGKFTYSDIKVLQNTELLVNIYPNPMEDVLNISFYRSEFVDVKIMDYMGNIVYQTITNHDIVIDTHLLSSGLYVLSIENENAHRIEQKITKR